MEKEILRVRDEREYVKKMKLGLEILSKDPAFVFAKAIAEKKSTDTFDDYYDGYSDYDDDSDHNDVDGLTQLLFYADDDDEEKEEVVENAAHVLISN